MKNIFENAYFRKPYKTRSNKNAVYVGSDDYGHLLEIEGIGSISHYDNYGRLTYPYDREYDIVSEWQEEINEEELKELARHYIETTDMPCRYEETAFYAFISGYKKAKEKQ